MLHPSSREPDLRQTPLHKAAHAGNLDEVARLLKDGATVGCSDIAGDTPLHLAAARGHLEVVRYLLGRGAPVDAKCRQKWTPLMHACNSGHPAIVNLLLKHGASASNRDDQGWTPLHFAATGTEKQFVEVVRILLGRKGGRLTVNQATKNGETPLDLAIEKGHPEIVDLLQRKGTKRGKPIRAAQGSGDESKEEADQTDEPSNLDLDESKVLRERELRALMSER